MQNTVSCKIEHHAILFALLAKEAILECGAAGKEAILEGMTTYGNERGARMAANALAHGDELNTMTNQAYGEWKPDYDGQMEFGQLRTQPTLQTYISKCAWCDAWKKHNLTEYGKYYCVNVDNAVYQGFRSDFVCTPTTTSLSWGGERCEFDWGYPLTDEENELLAAKKKELGTSCMKYFNYHTAHLKYTISKTLIDKLGEAGQKIVARALKDYVDTFGQEYLDVLDGVYPGKSPQKKEPGFKPSFFSLSLHFLDYFQSGKFFSFFLFQRIVDCIYKICIHWNRNVFKGIGTLLCLLNIGSKTVCRIFHF